MEILANNIDRLITVEIQGGDFPDRGIIAPLYEAARKAVNGRPLTLAAAERLAQQVHSGDTVIILTGIGSLPMFPHGETDGPPGAVCLARAINVGLGAIPLFTTGERDIPTIKACLLAIGVHVEDYEIAKSLSSAGTIIPLPYDEESARRMAKEVMDKYQPKAVLAVEAIGPNRKGIVHSRLGYAYGSQMPKLHQVFAEANSRGILTIGCIDSGNELGSGTIEDTVRRFHPRGDTCLCPCQSGVACAIKAEICVPGCCSNWAAYGIAAMLAILLKKPEVLHSAEMERRVLEACARTGCADTYSARPVPVVDGKSSEANQSVIILLHEMIKLELHTGTWRDKPTYMLR